MAHVPPHALTKTETIHVKKILSLLGSTPADSILSIEVSKPPAVVFKSVCDDCLSCPADTAENLWVYATIQLYAFKTFMMSGYWYNMGCKNLLNFLDWIQSNIDTQEHRHAFKMKLGTICDYTPAYFRATLFPLLTRFLFHYASPYKSMEQTNIAFHKFLWVPTWSVTRVLLIANREVNGDNLFPLLPPEIIRFILELSDPLFYK